MMETKLPEGYEVCEREHATHAVELNGTLHNITLSCGYLAISLADSVLFPASWERLGITPLRKAKPKPIEFSVRAISIGVGNDYLMQVLVDGEVYDTIPEEWGGKTFIEKVDE